jgi:hypothetical protein
LPLFRTATEQEIEQALGGCNAWCERQYCREHDGGMVSFATPAA